MSKVGRPKGFRPSAETRAKTAAALKARMQNDPAFREQVLRALAKGGGPRGGHRPVVRPPRGTPASGLFETIRKAINSAAAHVELRRGA